VVVLSIVFDPDSKIREIVSYTFSNSGIRAIRIPNNVEKIGKCCFCRCKSLYEVVFESNYKLKEIGGYAFFSCGVKGIEIPSSCERF
jgi:hypothetical protein